MDPESCSLGSFLCLFNSAVQWCRAGVSVSVVRVKISMVSMGPVFILSFGRVILVSCGPLGSYCRLGLSFLWSLVIISVTPEGGSPSRREAVACVCLWSAVCRQQQASSSSATAM